MMTRCEIILDPNQRPRSFKARSSPPSPSHEGCRPPPPAKQLSPHPTHTLTTRHRHLHQGRPFLICKTLFTTSKKLQCKRWTTRDCKNLHTACYRKKRSLKRSSHDAARKGRLLCSVTRSILLQPPCQFLLPQQNFGKGEKLGKRKALKTGLSNCTLHHQNDHVQHHIHLLPVPPRQAGCCIRSSMLPTPTPTQTLALPTTRSQIPHAIECG